MNQFGINQDGRGIWGGPRITVKRHEIQSQFPEKQIVPTLIIRSNNNCMFIVPIASSLTQMQNTPASPGPSLFRRFVLDLTMYLKVTTFSLTHMDGRRLWKPNMCQNRGLKVVASGLPCGILRLISVVLASSA